MKVSIFINVTTNMSSTMYRKELCGPSKAHSHLIGIYVDGDVDRNVLTKPVMLSKFKLLSIIYDNLRVAITHDSFYLEELKGTTSNTYERHINLEFANLNFLDGASALLFHFEEDVNIDTFQEVIYPATVYGDTLKKLIGKDETWPLSGLAATRIRDYSCFELKTFRPKNPIVLGAGYLCDDVTYITDLSIEDTRALKLTECLLEVDDVYKDTKGTSPQVFYFSDGETKIFGDINQIFIPNFSINSKEDSGVVIDLIKSNDYSALDLSGGVTERYEGHVFSKDSQSFEGVVVKFLGDGTMSVYFANIGEIASPIQLVTNGDMSITRTVNYLSSCKPELNQSLNEKLEHIGVYKADPFGITEAYGDITSEDQLPRLLDFVNVLRECFKNNNIIIHSIVATMDRLYPIWRESYPMVAAELERRVKLSELFD